MNAGSYGLYCSSVPNSGNGYVSRGLYFDLSGYLRPDWGIRYYGESVRPVQDFTE